MLEHKNISVLPEVDFTGDEGDPRWSGEDVARLPGNPHFTYLRAPGAYAVTWKHVKEGWEETARAWEHEPGSFYRSWHYLNEHPLFWRFRSPGMLQRPRNHIVYLEHEYGFGSDGINVMVVRTDITGLVNPDENLNTQTEVQLEAGEWSLFPEESQGGQYVHVHDYDIDCGGPTYEHAVISLAFLVWKKYGNDRQVTQINE